MAAAKTGSFAAFELTMGRGATIAVDQINAKGGVDGCKLQLTWTDTASDPAKGGQVAQQLISAGSKVLITPSDFDFGTPASLESKKAGIFAMSLVASSPDWPKVAGPYFAIGGQTATDTVKALSKFAIQKNWKNAYVVTNVAFNVFKTMQSIFGKSYPGLGGHVVGTDSVEDTATDFSPQIQRIKQASPAAQVILLNDYYPHVSAFIKQLRSAGVTTPVMGNGTYASPDLVKATGVANMKDVYYAEQMFWEGPTAVPSVRKMLATYKADYGSGPANYNAVDGWEAMYWLAMALEQAKSTDASAVNSALNAQHNVRVGGGLLYSWNQGVSEQQVPIIGFNPTGEAIQVASVDPRGVQ